MAIREPVSHQIVHGKWDDMMEVEKRWFAIEQEIGGFPMKRASQPIAGRDGMSVYMGKRLGQPNSDGSRISVIPKIYGECFRSNRVDGGMYG